ncbi:hypothetical protein AJ80_09060 [Polytolypa hystricis UAMH7299]|uniref:Uncharacterized protein n=1 Tax=Polytolypa hystricis (strain UAMH7299) TaxID=1447883 RepID=A0A2B7WWY1_POLH7|nr:hypothetical protein AJ80_09060 [Polytolypa hystricis UAMH7299]
MAGTTEDAPPGYSPRPAPGHLSAPVEPASAQTGACARGNPESNDSTDDPIFSRPNRRRPTNSARQRPTSCRPASLGRGGRRPNTNDDLDDFPSGHDDLGGDAFSDDDPFFGDDTPSMHRRGGSRLGPGASRPPSRSSGPRFRDGQRRPRSHAYQSGYDNQSGYGYQDEYGPLDLETVRHISRFTGLPFQYIEQWAESGMIVMDQDGRICYAGGPLARDTRYLLHTYNIHIGLG